MGFNTFPCNPYPISTEELHKGDNEELQAQIDAIKDGSEIDSFGDVETALGVVTEAITGLGTSKAAKADIAPTFSAEGTYAVGDLVYYEGVLYKCTTAHEEAAWDAEDFTVTSVVEEVCAINSNLNSLITSGSATLDSNYIIGYIDWYKIGNVIYIFGSIEFTADIPSTNQLIATGLPTISAAKNIIANIFNGDSTRLYLGDDGLLYTWYDAISNGTTMQLVLITN